MCAGCRSWTAGAEPSWPPRRGWERRDYPWNGSRSIRTGRCACVTSGGRTSRWSCSTGISPFAARTGQPALTRPEGGAFLAFVLLEAPAWDPDQFRRDLRDLYGIPCLTEAEESEDGGSTLTFEVSGMLAAVCLYPFPVPHGEAEENAAHNYLWPEAAESAPATGASCW